MKLMDILIFKRFSVVHQNVHYTKVERMIIQVILLMIFQRMHLHSCGNDSYGTLQDSNTRSDANLLLTVILKLEPF